MRNALWVLGDSILKGIIYDAQKNRHCLLGPPPAQQIAQQLQMPLHNHSAMGATLDRALRILNRQQPGPGDIVLIGYGGNACDFDWARVALEPDRPHECRTPLSTFLGLYGQVIAASGPRGAEPVGMTLRPSCPSGYFGWFSWGSMAAILRCCATCSRFTAAGALFPQRRRTGLAAGLPRHTSGSFLRQRNCRASCAHGIHQRAGYQLMVQWAWMPPGGRGCWLRRSLFYSFYLLASASVSNLPAQGVELVPRGASTGPVPGRQGRGPLVHQA